MIKRDTIRRVRLIPTNDGQGGSDYEVQKFEYITVNASINTTFGEINQYGVKDQLIVHIVSNIKLDEYVNTRYEYSGRLFKLIRQIKSGNEFFSVLMETAD